MFSLCMCVHDEVSFQYTALRNHRSVIQQTMDIDLSDHLSNTHALIGGRCGCAPLVCEDMHDVVVLYIVWQCDQICLHYCECDTLTHECDL